MTRTEFSAWCKTVHLLDGATGSMLRRAGMPAGVCSETWILDHPQTLIALQRAYLAAGSEIIYAPTFGANRVLLGHHDLQREVRALNRDLVQLGREAVGTSALLAGDITTTGRPITPGDDSAYETLLEIYREQAEALLRDRPRALPYEGYEGTFNVFFELETYRNLALGAAVYVALFDRRYKPGGGRLDISETLAAVLEAMYVIVLTWGITLFAIVNYHLGGMSYSAGLRERYRANGWIKNDNAAEDAAAVREMTSGVLEDGGVELEKGKRYRIMPQEDGSMVIEVIEE